MHVSISHLPCRRAERRKENVPVLNVDEALRVRIAEVGLMGEAEVDLCFVERVFDLVWIDAGRQAGDDLLHLELVRVMQYVVVDENVVPQEVELIGPMSISKRGWQT